MARIPVCMCNNCNNVGTVKIDIANRGGRNGYLCSFHAVNLESYSARNNENRGVDKKNGFTFGCEFETNSSTTKGRAELVNFGFIPTSDCTVNAEYKSPIFKGLNALSKQCVSIDKLIANNDISVEDSAYNTTGTHLHVGHVDAINQETMDYIRRFYHSLFVPLSNVMKDTPEATEAFWGRNFTHYASPINQHSSAMAHENFINLQHNKTIEFRLAKYQNAQQYMNIAKFARDVVNTIITNFIDHFNDADFDSRRYANITEYRKHKAKVTADKIVKLYKKYANID